MKFTFMLVARPPKGIVWKIVEIVLFFFFFFFTKTFLKKFRASVDTRYSWSRIPSEDKIFCRVCCLRREIRSFVYEKEEKKERKEKERKENRIFNGRKIFIL